MKSFEVQYTCISKRTVWGGGFGLQYIFYISLGSFLDVEFEKGSGVKFRA